VFSTHNYIIYKLTGTYCIDYKVASSFGELLDTDRLEWREELLTWVGIDKSHFPRLCSPIEIVGQLTQEASSVTGLPVGLPVICSSGDSLLTLIGNGVINQGEAVLSLGTSGWLGVLPYDLEVYFHNPFLTRQGAPYLLCAYLLSLGSTLCWIRDKFAFSEKLMAEQQGISMFQLLDEAAGNIPAGSEGVCIIPYFQGNWQINLKEPDSGVIFGLKLSHNPIHIYRGLLESYGYIVRSAIEKLRTDGILLRRFVYTGSGSKSVLWRQIISDITGKSWLYYANLEPSLGNAFLVGYALGNFPSLTRIQDWLPEPLIHSPNIKVRQVYDKAYERFVLLWSKLSV
jgi:sugar (pentulose or hexulose) kinase